MPVDALVSTFGRVPKGRLRSGIQIDIDVNDDDGRELFLFGLQEPAVLAVLRRLAPRIGGFLDVGANHGAIGLTVAGWLKETDADVHLVEPQPHLAASIRAAVLDTRQLSKKVTVHEIALGDRRGTVTLNLIANHSGAASILPIHSSKTSAGSVEVELQMTSEWLEGVLGNKQYGAKVDAEGAEELIVPSLFADPRIEFVVFEASLLNRTPVITEAAQLYGFELKGIRTGFVSTRLESVSFERDLNVQFKDCVAIRRQTPQVGPQHRRGGG